MTEAYRIKLLTEQMAYMWAWCWENGGGFREQEAKRIRDKKQWDRQVDELKAQLLLYLENDQSILDNLIRDYPNEQLVWLVALDRVLWACHADLAGDREPPTMVPHEKVEWMVFRRHRSLGPTVYQNQSYHIRNHLSYNYIIPNAESGNSIQVVMPGPSLQRGLQSLVKSQRLVKCYLGSFADGIQPDWNGMPNQKCTCSQLADLAGRRESLHAALEEARMLKADVVVLGNSQKIKYHRLGNSQKIKYHRLETPLPSPHWGWGRFTAHQGRYFISWELPYQN